MGYSIGWLDKELHIYEISITDPFTQSDNAQFFTDCFRFMNEGPSPMFGIFDVSKWSESGVMGIVDSRFVEFSKYRTKIPVIVMVTNNRLAQSIGRLGATIAGYREWIHFESSRQKAISYLKNRATTDLKKTVK